MTKFLRVGVGLALFWGAFGIFGYRFGWELHSRRGSAALLNAAHQRLLDHGRDACSAEPIDGQLAGVLQLPSLAIKAPVEQGTEDTELNVAVGHFDASPWPGNEGDSALLAHDVSYFAHIDQLRPGAEVVYQAPCDSYVFRVESHTIVRAGAPLPPTTGVALTLDTCWPTNALWWTPQRYLVQAVETAVVPRSPQSGSPLAPGTKKLTLTNYTTPAPATLVAQGLDLGTNETPMGTLRITGPVSSAWEQSPSPLRVEATALEAYFGALHASGQRRLDWWSDLAPGVALPAPLSGENVVGHDAPLDVTIAGQGDQATGVIFDTVITLAGGANAGTYAEHVTESIDNASIVIASWALSPR